ncbi:DUF4935 domain-containing protein [Aphanizomenon flos-aquae FACHB-1040]|uniref:DUF4935 domain-containing protein n=2 Tax=Aphanizomenon flos-aquae TaxID=1176 RepID=A0ABR8BW57_APHFL|nr:DUF4935 domain-containing protein [Aphanizomenon flos-aquae FACHB-1040]
MRDLFPGHYQPTKQEFDELWKECIFSFDTNVLLHIYRYSPKTRERLFDILEKLQERIWIPHQVGYEFHKNRLNVISSQSNAYDKLVKILEDNLKIEKIGDLSKQLDQYEKDYNRHSTIEVNKKSGDIKTKIKELIKTVIESVKNDLQDSKENHPDLSKEDPFQNRMIEILNGRIGSPYPDLLNIYKLAEERFKYLIPPGYKDKDDRRKSVPDIYGDAILWLQLIDYAKSEKKPIIFVTDDDKEDWWLENGRKTISPRPELVQEMLTEAGVGFYMYSADRFLDYAQKFLELSEQPEVIEEAREIREQEKDIDSLSDIQDSANLEIISKALENIEKFQISTNSEIISKALENIEKFQISTNSEIISKALENIEKFQISTNSEIISKALENIEKFQISTNSEIISKALENIEKFQISTNSEIISKALENIEKFQISTNSEIISKALENIEKLKISTNSEIISKALENIRKYY